MRSRIFLLGLFVVFSVGLAKADQVGDPIIKTGGGGTLSPLGLAIDSPAPAGIITTSFTITTPSGTSPGTSPCVLSQGGITTTSPQCLFENDISVNGGAATITSLVFDAPTIPFDPTKDFCGFLSGSPFAMCGVDALMGGGTEFSFTDGSIPFHTDFTLDFEGFPKNTSFAGTATVSPEPATLGLFLSGIAAAFVRKRARAKA
jgi:hypothetical protein